MTTLSSAQSKSAQCHTVLRFVNVDVMVEAGKFSFFKLMQRDGEMGHATQADFGLGGVVVMLGVEKQRPCSVESRTWES